MKKKLTKIPRRVCEEQGQDCPFCRRLCGRGCGSVSLVDRGNGAGRTAQMAGNSVNYSSGSGGGGGIGVGGGGSGSEARRHKF